MREGGANVVGYSGRGGGDMRGAGGVEVYVVRSDEMIP